MSRWWLVLLAACGPEAAPEGPGTVRVLGPDIVTARLIPALSRAYTTADPHAPVFDVDGATEADAFGALFGGGADVAASTRGPYPIEVERADAAGFHLGPESRHIVAVNVIAVSVHDGNPLESVTYDQVIGLFCTGTIDNWQFLGDEDRPVHAWAPAAQSGSREVFEDFFCGPRGLAAGVRSGSADEIDAALEADPDAVAFGSVATSTAKLLSLRANAEAQAVGPSQGNAIRGLYPLYTDLYLYTTASPDAGVQRFLDWIGSPAGQDVVDQARFLPLYLRPGQMNERRPLRETIHFDPGSAQPNSHSLVRIGLLVAELRDRVGSNRHIVLEGFADSEEADGMQLSEARAKEVESLLKKELPGTYFEIIPRASDRPIAPNTTPYGRQQNRRVQIYLADEERPG
jgi:phosphate transport system substrate-binding protein